MPKTSPLKIGPDPSTAVPPSTSAQAALDSYRAVVTARAARRIANQLAHAARRGTIDLADEAAAIEFLEARGWNTGAVEQHVTEALENARGILWRARLSDFIGNAVAVALLVFAVAFSGSRAQAAVCPPAAEPEGWSTLAMAAVALLSTLAGVVVMAAMCASGDVASEEERRDPESMRRS